MAIVKMSKFSLFAFDSEREGLLDELQKFQYVHFTDLGKDNSYKEMGLKNAVVPENVSGINEELTKVKYGIDILSKYDSRESGIKAMQKGLETYDFNRLIEEATSIDYISIFNQLREVTTKKDALLQEISKINASINELEPWIKLEFPIKNLNSFEHSEVLLGTIPKKLKQRLESELMVTEYTYFEALSEDRDNLYILIITSNLEGESVKDILRNNNFSSQKLFGLEEPAIQISRYNEKIKTIQSEIESYDNTIKSLSGNLPKLEIVYEYLMNQKLKMSSSESFMMTENINVIEGYIPSDMVDDFTTTINEALSDIYYMSIEEADENDPNVPTLLKNSKFTKAFESLTGMYALPKYNEIDPTPFLAPFYLAFFGMMVADLGYGLIMLVGTVVMLKLFNLSEDTKNFIRFFFYLSFSTILWGLIFGSFLGGIIPMPALITPATQYNELLIISIAFGIVHLFFALGLKAYLSIRDKRYLDALFDVGFWYMALAGGTVFLISMVTSLPVIIKNISLAVMVIGMVGIVATGGRSAKGVAGKAAGGLYSLYGISSYVGDFVSYSRLMALGLSGGFIASAVNMMVGMLFDKGIAGIIGGILVFFIGQAFNIFLSVLGAYVHTIRLTYVEFFGKFYEGGGKGFKLFRSKPKYINLK